MKKLIVSMVLFLCFVCFLSSCTSKQAANDQPKRIVAASRSIAEMWLLAGGELVGTTEDAMDLKGITDQIQMIGTNTKLNLEIITALKPDLVFLSGSIPTHKTVQKALEDMGINCSSVEVNNFDDYASIMKTFTEMTDHDDLYQKHVGDVKTRIDDLLKKAADLESKTYLTIRISSLKTTAMKDEFFVCQMLNDFNCKNASDTQTNVDLSLEGVFNLNPDYIFIVTQGDEQKSRQLYEKTYTSQKAWQGLKAAKNNQIHLLPKDMFEYKPNAKWDEAYDYLYQILTKA